MRVRRTGENAELGEHLRGNAVLGQHALDRVLDDEFRVTLAHQGNLAVALAADEAREEHVLVLDFLLAGERDLFRIDNNHEIAGVDAGGVGSLVTAADDVGGLNGETTERNPGSIDQIPLGLHRLLLGEERFHAKRGKS